MTAAQLSQRRAAGRLGGQVTKTRYGVEHLQILGKTGGRPRLPTLAELESQGNKKTGGVAIRPEDLSTSSFTALMRLYRKQRQERWTTPAPG